jgi:hypothetical protein
VVIASFAPGGDPWYTATVADPGFRFRSHGCGEFLITADLACVEVRPDPTGQPELLPILLAGTICSFLLTMRGTTVLHASAVAIGDETLAFIGHSGRGKTTMAALLCTAGAELVTDDVLAVQPGPPMRCVGGATELRLRPAAMAIAESGTAGSTRMTVDDRLALAPRRAPDGPRRLSAIVVPGPSREASAVEVRRLSASDSLLALLSFPRVMGWSRPDVLMRDFATLSQVANEVPVYDVTVPWGPPFDPAVVAELHALVA